MKDRGEYVEWCKARAREYLETGSAVDAVTSMISDMNNRDDCRVPIELAQIGTLLLMKGGSYHTIKDYIEGFH
jgi:hypothetical protein